MAALKKLEDIDFSKVKVTVVEGKPDTRTEEQKELDAKAIDAWLEAGHGGYTTEQLREAFKVVANKEHWKYDIDADVPRSMRNILEYAIPYHVGGGHLEFIDLDDDKMRVLAAGYFTNGMEDGRRSKYVPPYRRISTTTEKQPMQLSDLNIGDVIQIRASQYRLTEIRPTLRGTMTAGRGKIGVSYRIDTALVPKATMIKRANAAAPAPVTTMADVLAAAPATRNRAPEDKVFELMQIDPHQQADWTNMCLAKLGSKYRYGDQLTINGRVVTINGYDPRERRGLPVIARSAQQTGSRYYCYTADVLFI